MERHCKSTEAYSLRHLLTRSVVQTGVLQNPQQTNCPDNKPCSLTSGCVCPTDLNGDAGALINQFTGYQCSYNGGSCTWNVVRIGLTRVLFSLADCCFAR